MPRRLDTLSNLNPRLCDEPRRPARGAVEPVSLVWEGTQFRHHSLAVVNREICSRLIARGHDLEARLYEEHQFDSSLMPRYRELEGRFDRPCHARPRILVRHQWPPCFEDSDEEVRVMIQPWEFGSVPRTWVERMGAEVDELWVPSRYNRQCYIDGGLDPARVRIIPNGVDLERFHPDGPAMRIESRKSVTFLFVGGTIPRKGVKQLLSAFCTAFGPKDDVRLIIKDVGARGVYKGSTEGAKIRALASRPACPEIHYIDRDLAQEDLVSLYRTADVLVHPYLGEGFGMPIVEAMACGLPVIVTGLGAAMDFCNRDNAWLIPAVRKDAAGYKMGDLELVDHPWLAEPAIDPFVAALREAARRPDLRRARGRAGRELVEREFGWEQVVDMVEERLVTLDRGRARLTDPGVERIILEAPTRAELEDESGDLAAIRRLQDSLRPAVAALADGDAEGAERLFLELVAAYPELAAAHAGLGRARLHAGRAEEARAPLEEALRILPEDKTVRLDLAAVAIAGSRPDEARALLEAVVAADDDDRHARLLLARIARDEARIDEAADLVATVLRIDPTDADALHLFALVARDLGYRDGFDRALKRLARVAPERTRPAWS